MKNLKPIISFLFFFQIAFFGCNTESNGPNQDAHKVEEKVPSSEQIELGQEQGIVEKPYIATEKDTLFLESDSNTLNILMISVKEEEKELNFTPEGLEKSKRLKEILANCNLKYIYVYGNSALQMGLPISEKGKASIGQLRESDLFPLPEIIMQSFSDEQVLVIGGTNMINNLLAELTGSKKHAMPPNEFDLIYVAKTKEIGSATVSQIRL